MHFGEKLENFFEKFSVPTTHWRSNLGLAESFWKFLPSLPTGHGKCIWSLTLENFFPLLLFGDEWCVLTNFLQNFSPLPPADKEADFSKKFIFLYEISAALVYMGEMSPPTIHWRWNCGLNRESKNFFSSAYKRKIHPNRTPFRSKMSRSLFCPPTYPLRMKMPFGRKYRKFIFRPHTYPCGWTSRFGGENVKFHNFSLLTSLPRK